MYQGSSYYCTMFKNIVVNIVLPHCYNVYVMNLLFVFYCTLVWNIVYNNKHIIYKYCINAVFHRRLPTSPFQVRPSRHTRGGGPDNGDPRQPTLRAQHLRVAHRPDLGARRVRDNGPARAALRHTRRRRVCRAARGGGDGACAGRWGACASA